MSTYRGSTDCGSIELILGPMFSGKTTEMMRRVKRYSIAGHSCLVIKNNRDTRYDVKQCATHDKFVIKQNNSIHNVLFLFLV